MRHSLGNKVDWVPSPAITRSHKEPHSVETGKLCLESCPSASCCSCWLKQCHSNKFIDYTDQGILAHLFNEVNSYLASVCGEVLASIWRELEVNNFSPECYGPLRRQKPVKFQLLSNRCTVEQFKKRELGLCLTPVLVLWGGGHIAHPRLFEPML